jgi:tyrosinase
MKKLLFALILAVFVCGLLLLPSAAHAQTTPPPERQYIRKNVYTPEGQRDLQTLANALSIMRQRGCQNPTSWYFQGAIHWIPAPETYTQGNPLCRSYSSVTAQAPQVQSLLTNFWQKCPHPTGLGIHFLPWHRLYVYYFEQAVRTISGDPDFALPYWDYTNNESQQNRFMPEAFRIPANATNSLYERLRNRNLNNGNSIPSFTQEDLIRNKQQAYRTVRFRDFTSQIEQSPHNTVHGILGGSLNQSVFNPITQRNTFSGLMTSVPTAGFDPIFWVHHTSIDRFWESWTRATNIRVTPQELNSVSWPYRFYDGNGQEVNYSTSQAVIDAVYNPDYTYDELEQLTPSPRLQLSRSPNALIPARSQETVVSSEEVKTNLTDELTTVVVPLPTPVENERNLINPSVSATTPSVNETYELEVQVSFKGQPRGTYDVYVNLPNTEATVDKDAYYVGVISFFEVPSAKRVTKTLLFDISDQLLEQVKRSQQPSANQNLTVSFRAKDGSPSQDIVIEKITLRKLG